MDAKVLFCHGLETGPFGRKYAALVQAGFEVESPDCQGMSLLQRVKVVMPLMQHVSIVVGSSFGGAVAVLASMRAGIRLKGIVLCAPALDRVEEPAQLHAVAPTIILHGLSDDVVPIEVSRRYAQRTGVELIELQDDHRLSRSDPVMIQAVRRLIGSVPGGHEDVA